VRNYVRVSVPGIDTGKPHITQYDKFVAVDEDGNEAEFSQCVTKWELISEIGSIRILRVDLLAFLIDGDDTHLKAASNGEDAQATKGTGRSS
jgi:hypothetical protein